MQCSLCVHVPFLLSSTVTLYNVMWRCFLYNLVIHWIFLHPIMHSDKIWIWSEYYYCSITHVYNLTECSWPSELCVFLKFLVHTLLVSIMLFDGLVSGTKLHFTTLERGGESVPTIHISIVVVWSVQVSTVAVIVPPSCSVGLSTVSWTFIIIPVRCWEWHPIIVIRWPTSPHPITGCSTVCSKI